MQATELLSDIDERWHTSGVPGTLPRDVARRLIANGWRTVPILGPRHDHPSAGKGTLLPGWQRLAQYGAEPQTPDVVETWPSRIHEGVGLLCGDVVGIDVDVDDEPTVAAVVAIADRVFGRTPFRRQGRALRVTLLFRAGERIPGGRIEDARHEPKKGPAIDVLSDGKQSVAYGVHPKTEKLYRWLGTAEPLSHSPSVAPAITVAQLEAFRAAIDAEVFPVRGKLALAHLSAANDDFPPLTLSEAAIRRLDAWVPLLNLPECGPSGNGYKFLSFWRETTSGAGRRRRNRSSSATRRGIRDHALSERISPVELVRRAVAAGLVDIADPVEWLTERVEFVEPTLAGFISPPSDLETAQTAIRAEVEAWLAAAEAAEPAPLDDAVFKTWANAGPDAPADVRVLRATVGSGKTKLAIEAVAAWRPASRGNLDPGRALLWLVPSLELAAQAAADLRAAGVTVEVLKGRAAEGMCALAETDDTLVQDMEMVGALGVQKSFCSAPQQAADGSPLPPLRCPLFDVCPYQRQARAVRETDLGLRDGPRVWIAAHAALKFDKLPRNVCAVFVDEDITTTLVSGEMRMDLEKLAAAQTNALADGVEPLEALDFAVLGRIAPDLAALPSMSPIPVFDQQTVAELKTAAKRASAIADSISVTLWPGMPKAARGPAIDDLLRRKGWVKVAGFCSKLASADPNTVTMGGYLSHQHRHRVPRHLTRRPWLLADATARMELIVPLLPAARFVLNARIDVDRAFVENILVTGLTVSKRALDAEDSRNLKRLARYIRSLQGEVLVVTNQTTESSLKALDLGETVVVRHFGELAGLNHFSDVDHLVVAGSQLVPPLGLERTALAITGRQPERVVGFHPRHDEVVTLRDGTTVGLRNYRHPDPVVEALRWRACEAELLQAAGRGRALRRPFTGRKLTLHWFVDNPPAEVTFDARVRVGETVASLAVDVAEACGGFPVGRPGALNLLMPDPFPDEESLRFLETEGWPSRICDPVRSPPRIEISFYVGDCAPGHASVIGCVDGREHWYWVEVAGRTVTEVETYLRGAGLDVRCTGPSTVEDSFAAIGMATDGPNLASLLDPTRWPSVDAAKRDDLDLSRVNGARFSCVVRRRGRPVAVVVDLARHPDPLAAIEARLGFSVEKFEPVASSAVEGTETPADPVPAVLGCSMADKEPIQAEEGWRAAA